MVGCADGLTSGDKEDLGIRAADNIIFAAGGSTERLRIDSSGGALHGSGAIATKKCSPGGFDVACNNLSFVFGADSNAGNDTQARTNNAAKDSRISAVHYANAEETIGIVRAYSDSTTNQLYWGGGSSLFNAATQMSFYTAANNTTTNGTERLRIHSGGTVNVPSGIVLGQTIGSTASSNTLDDYEEGSVDLKLRGNTTSTGEMICDNGTYTKIGRIVILKGQWINRDGSNLPQNQTISMTNLPFTPSGRHITSNIMLHNVVFNTSGIQYFFTNSTGLMGYQSVSGGAWAGWNSSNWRVSGLYFDFTAVYEVS